jgi:hypothetical protein
MLYLYQKDKWALAGNLQNRRYSLVPCQCSVTHYRPHFFRRDQSAESELPLADRLCAADKQRTRRCASASLLTASLCRLQSSHVLGM